MLCWRCVFNQRSDDFTIGFWLPMSNETISNSVSLSSRLGGFAHTNDSGLFNGLPMGAAKEKKTKHKTASHASPDLRSVI